MSNDPYVARRRIDYFTAMVEAKTEYLVWEREQNFADGPLDSGRVCACGRAVARTGKCDQCKEKERATKFPPCSCGGPYFAKSMCRKCYYKAYNKIQSTRRKMMPPVW